MKRSGPFRRHTTLLTRKGPPVIRLRPNRRRPPIGDLRAAVLARAGHCCDMCGGPLPSRWECHHRRLRSQGGRVGQLIALCGADEELARRVRSLARAGIPELGPTSHAGPGRGHKTNSATTGFGRGAEYAVARLKREDPALAARVVSGEVTPNAAAHQKGWRKPRVLLANPDTVARRIRETFTPDQIARLIALLIGDDP